jgi:cobalt-zinc-cadmium efflux system outer membrane protein
MESSVKARIAFASVLLIPAVAIASAETVTEADAIRLFLEKSPQATNVPLVVRSVEAGSRVGTQVANPAVAYQLEDALGVRDEFLTFEQELPLTGRRELLGKRARAAAAAAGLAAEGDLQDDAYGVKLSFYEVLYRERVLDRLRSGAVLMEHTVEILRRREREGEGSGYDALRAEQELAAVRMSVAEAEAALAVARSRFGSFFDPDRDMGAVRLDGELESVDPVPTLDGAIEQALEQRIDLRALSADRERLELERRAARRQRFPEPTLMAGWKRTEALGLSDTGYIAYLSVPLPIFDRGRPETARATVDRERIELDVEIMQRRIRADVQAAVAREHAARESARQFGHDAERRAIELRRIAQLRYDEGESGILELLDAHRTSLTMELRALAARYEAKHAEIERNRAIGVEVQR